MLRLTKEGNKAIGVIYVDTITGEEFEQPADVVVVASYVFNNARLLLNSGLGTPYNPETGKGSIGKNYAYQVTAGHSTAFFEDREFNLYAGAGAQGMEIPQYTGDNFDHKDNNYLELDPEYKDAYGMPLLRMIYDYTEQDRQLVKHMAGVTSKIAEAMGADIIDTAAEQGPFNVNKDTNTHNTGGVIMGADPATSAVNSYLQMWGAENVFVVGASAFPHNSNYNPTGTLGALSYRAAEGIQTYLKQGGLLVK